MSETNAEKTAAGREAVHHIMEYFKDEQVSDEVAVEVLISCLVAYCDNRSELLFSLRALVEGYAYLKDRFRVLKRASAP